ncbi:MAG: hypothetical protein E7667_00895 [Ruminococcaceae bacterium]|nr:hypothetical protein [Oscillospiraceae bacterium]
MNLRKLAASILCICLVLSVMFVIVACDSSSGDEKSSKEQSTKANTDDKGTEAPTNENVENPTQEQPTETPTEDGSKEDPTETPTDDEDEDKVLHTVTVSDMFDGAPIKDVTVGLYNRNDELVMSSNTDSNGKAEFLALDMYYIVKLSNVPENYDNTDTYIFVDGYELNIALSDPSDNATDGSDADHALPVFDDDEISIAGGATVYCISARTSGYVLTLKNASGLMVTYKETEYLPVDGVITVEFEEQNIDVLYSEPNEFVITNLSDTAYTQKISLLPKNAGESKDNPFMLKINEMITTPDFIAGTSLADPGITVYYYEWIAIADGTISISTSDASISVYLNESSVPLVDEENNPATTAEIEIGDYIIITVENPNFETSPVSFQITFTEQ